MYLGCRNLQEQVRKCIFVAKSFIYFCNCSRKDVLTIIFCHYNLTEKKKIFFSISIWRIECIFVATQITQLVLQLQGCFEHYKIANNYLIIRKGFIEIHFMLSTFYPWNGSRHKCCRIRFTENVLRPKVIYILSRLGLTEYCLMLGNIQKETDAVKSIYRLF